METNWCEGTRVRVRDDVVTRAWGKVNETGTIIGLDPGKVGKNKVIVKLDRDREQGGGEAVIYVDHLEVIKEE